jgi:hypothetical protein
MAQHTHQYTIADDEAVKVLLDQLLSSGPHQQHREKLLKAPAVQRGHAGRDHVGDGLAGAHRSGVHQHPRQQGRADDRS